MFAPVRSKHTGDTLYLFFEIDATAKRIEIIISNSSTGVTKHYISADDDEFMAQTFLLNALSKDDIATIPTIMTHLKDIQSKLTLTLNKQDSLVNTNEEMTRVVLKNGQFSYTFPLSQALPMAELKIYKLCNEMLSTYAACKLRQCNQLANEMSNKNHLLTKIVVAYDHALNPLSTRLSAKECVGVECVKNLFFNKGLLNSMISTPEQVKKRAIEKGSINGVDTIFADQDDAVWEVVANGRKERIDRTAAEKTGQKKGKSDTETDIESDDEPENTTKLQIDIESHSDSISEITPTARPAVKRKLQGLLRRYKKPKV
jgi:hypothetical protein